MNETWWVDPSQLDSQQKSILQATPDESLLIIGPPGSGKTNILMLRANYVRSVGPRQIFLTFTRPLVEHLRSGPNVGRADQIQTQEINTFMSWALTLISTYGGETPDDDLSFDDYRQAVAIELDSVINREEVGKIYDVIFVDEVQDFLEIELRSIGHLATRVNFAGDSRQRIWKHREGLTSAERLTDNKVELIFHYRIGERICEFADQIMPPKADQVALLEGCNYSEALRPSSVKVVSCKSQNEVIQSMISRLRDQLRYITDEPIGIIGPKNSALDAVMDAIQGDSLLEPITVRQKNNEYQSYDDNSRIRVMTIHGAKGSEFRAIHLLDGETFKLYNKELAFTAVTRAKTEVLIYHVAPLMGHMIPATGKLPTDLSKIF